VKKRKSPQTLAKLIGYILGRRPDEFGLIPDAEGFVKIKDLLKVMQEEKGWKHVRRQDLNEILVSLTPPPIEIKDNFIRAIHREFLPGKTPVRNLPRILYTCVRRRAYPAIAGKEELAASETPLVLSAEKTMAEKIGRRIDMEPVLLTVQAQRAQDSGTVFYQFGESIYLTRSLPGNCFSGPALPKQKPESVPKKAVEKAAPKRPGSYFPEPAQDKTAGTAGSRQGKTKKNAWKKDRKRLRRQKDKMWPK
jgi:putative RNA 2'-phosphotransferase